MKSLVSRLEFKVRFNEVDPLGIVWHGHYIRFFEDGREAFGSQHGLAYMDIYHQGFVAPVVNINCNYKKSLEYGDYAVVETTFVNHPAAKIIFNYKIFLTSTNELIAEGTSTQVFLDSEKRQLQLVAPAFYEKWKTEQGF
ncbi:MAG TPA: acyl-CoA thioesterase [Bacteroidia bacterium]|nr:acyl-CoA thioesterase [Bacteroidia bacterium]